MDLVNRFKIAKDVVNTIDRIKISNNSVIVYDIDDTLIDNNGCPILPVINTYHYAKNSGLTTVIITARPDYDENIQRTIQQLHYFGITGYKYIYFRPRDKEDQATFKLLARKNLHDRGYHVVASIGDMPWDIGLYGGIGFRV